MEQDQGKARRHYTPDQKFKIVKEQMTTKTSVSEICKKYDISLARAPGAPGIIES